ncbi:Vitamin B12 import ATP-binding protein BtuD [Candidatus Lokiarchaeum ossiferum]|uniref:Vitamin B12 import ATP-binding protein BtuD n=1 Tax=Candidatus Lokiarchaeum ossiferum TaxID=2951803 RepID=A0ABY6HUM1_9ARCH|nr:Vitamin B12 import ATP-binding protein BtuD [Candidatus Lokiarchaeum sp. B-35]
MTEATLTHHTFQRQNYKKWMFFHIVQNKMLFFLNLLGIILVTSVGSYIPVKIGEIIDNLIDPSPSTNFFVLLAILLGIYMTRNILEYTTWMIGHKLGSKTEQNMRQEFFETLQHKSLSYHDELRTGDLQALATNDLRIINTMIAHGSFYVYPFILSIVMIILQSQSFPPIMLIVTIPFLIIYTITVLDYRKKLTPFSKLALRKHADITVTVQDSIKGAEVTRAFSAEPFERKKFAKVVRAYKENWLGENKIQAKFLPMLTLYGAIGTTFLLSCIFVLQGKMTLGELTGLNLLLLTFLEPTNMIFWATKDMIGGFGASERLYRALSQGSSEEEIEQQSISSVEETNKINKSRLSGKIQFHDVSFSYQTAKANPFYILNKVNFSIEPNQQIALVGPTGGGKTTLVKLLQRFYHPQQGTILLDDIDIRKFPLNLLRKKIGYIEQDVFLFSQSIANNIRFGNPEASDEEVQRVAKLAFVDDFVQELPDKYDTLVGERGTKLSGGEKQRIAIARAFLVNPDILILDDSMSAIDSETESKIGQAINNILHNRTTIIITHRLHTIQISDKILVLKQGKIVAQGTHDTLLNTSPDYGRIFGNSKIIQEEEY